MKLFTKLLVLLILFTQPVQAEYNYINSFTAAGVSGIDYNVGFGVGVFSANDPGDVFTGSNNVAMGHNALKNDNTGCRWPQAAWSVP